MRQQCILGVCPRDPHDECADGHCHERFVEDRNWEDDRSRGYEW
jgi:hypothetical protein